MSAEDPKLISLSLPLLGETKQFSRGINRFGPDKIVLVDKVRRIKGEPDDKYNVVIIQTIKPGAPGRLIYQGIHSTSENANSTGSNL